MDITYECNTTGHILAWSIVDTTVAGPTYAIYRNGTQLINQTWTPGVPVTINVDGLVIGAYNYTLVAVDGCGDGYGGRSEDQVNVTVQNLPPSIPAVTNFAYEFSTTGHTIAWTITDASVFGPSYHVYRNGTDLGPQSWTSGTPVVVGIDGLSMALWNFTIAASDGLGNETRSTVWVTVQNVPPSLSPHADVTFAAGTTGQTLSWSVTDASVSGGTYAIYRYGTLLTNQTWTPGTPITIDVSDLTVGTYVYTIVVSDGFGGTQSDSLLVDVTPASAFPTEWVIIAGVGIAAVLVITIVVRKRRAKVRNLAS